MVFNWRLPGADPDVTSGRSEVIFFPSQTVLELTTSVPDSAPIDHADVEVRDSSLTKIRLLLGGEEIGKRLTGSCELLGFVLEEP